MSGICKGGHFLENCFYCYSQQIKSAVANKSLIPYNRIKRAPHFFWEENCYLLTWNLTHILSNLKSFKEAINTFCISGDIFYWRHHISAFSAGNLPFTCFCYGGKIKLHFFFAFRICASFNVIFIRTLLS